MKINFEKLTIFSIYFLSAIVYSSLLIFLISEILGSQTIYNFLKDQGSFIAGIIGVIGVLFLVLNQNKTTEKTVNATLKAIHIESKEVEKRTNKENLVKVLQHISNINNLSDKQSIKTELNKAIDGFTIFTIMNNIEITHIEKHRLSFINDMLLFCQYLIKLDADKTYHKNEFDIKAIYYKQAKLLRNFKELDSQETDEDTLMADFLRLSFLKEKEEKPDNRLPSFVSNNLCEIDEQTLNRAKHAVYLLKYQIIKTINHLDNIDLYK